MSSAAWQAFSVAVCAFFRVAGERLESAELDYTKGDTPERFPLLVDDATDLSGEMKALHAHVADFLAGSGRDSAQRYTAHKLLHDELRRAVWQVPVRKWAVDCLPEGLHAQQGERGKTDHFIRFRLSSLRAYTFPGGYCAICLEAAPCTADSFTPEQLLCAGRILTATLAPAIGPLSPGPNRTGLRLERVFSGDEARLSAANRFGESALPWSAALTGTPIEFGSLFTGLSSNLGACLERDRFATLAYVNTPWENTEEAFSKGDYRELLRLARGQTDDYLPCPLDAAVGGDVTLLSENIALACAGEGASYWVRPKEHQTFLREQFKSRFDAVHFHLLLLALYQRHAAIGLNRRLAEVLDVHTQALLPDTAPYPALDAFANALRQQRMEIVTFHFKHCFQLPSVLSNHVRYYEALQRGFGLPSYIASLQQDSRELDSLLNALAERQAHSALAEEQGRREEMQLQYVEKTNLLLEEQHRSGVVLHVIGLFTEASALPYYVYHVCEGVFFPVVEKLFKLHPSKNWAVAASLLVTLVALGMTLVSLVRHTRERRRHSK